MNFLIISGGAVSDDFACGIIKNGGYEIIIAADSGMELLHRLGIDPDMIVGDFDSVSEKVLEEYREKEHIEISMLDPVKDDTDTEHAIREAIRWGAKHITILGGTGTRLDHVLGNINLLGIGIEENVEIELLDPHNRVRMLDHGITLSKRKQYGKFFSLIPYTDEVKGVTLSGVKYPLDHYNMSGFNSLGISNEITEMTAEIAFEEGLLLLIESRD